MGDLSKLCTITCLITYPYARTVNFENCIEVQLTTHQPPNAELLKLKLGLIGISDIEWVKRKVPLLDSYHFFEN